jgi:hypothetical protein
MYDVFVAAIRDRLKVRVTFCADEDERVRTRTCYPMDFAPSRRCKDGISRYWFWDRESPEGPHPLGLLPSQVVSIASTGESFDPSEFVAWRTNWHVARDWGAFS